MHYNNDMIIKTKPRVMKPGIVKFYHSIMSRVDTADQMSNTYNVLRLCNYYTLRILFHLLNTANSNAFVLNYSAFPNTEMQC